MPFPQNYNFVFTNLLKNETEKEDRICCGPFRSTIFDSKRSPVDHQTSTDRTMENTGPDFITNVR